MKEYSLADLRREYKRAGLTKEQINLDPFAQLQTWVRQALEAGLPEPTAMTLSTVSPEGRPSSRIVLLKGVENEGLIFYTNYTSEKGRDLEANPMAALNFYWHDFERQARAEGPVEKVSRQKSAEYFHSRPRESQLGALVSDQSQEIPDRKTLEDQFRALQEKYDGEEIPLPEDWGGYALKPDVFEFWQGRPHRLHDRLRFERAQDAAGEPWQIKRLAP